MLRAGYLASLPSEVRPEHSKSARRQLMALAPARELAQLGRCTGRPIARAPVREERSACHDDAARHQRNGNVNRPVRGSTFRPGSGSLSRPSAGSLPGGWAGELGSAGLPRIWARKPMVAVAGQPCCAELAVVAELGAAGWQGAWISAFGGFVRRQRFPEPHFSTIAAAGATPWAAEIFDAVKDANSGTLSGFFDVFAWREPAEVLFCEVKVGPDRIRASQRQFLAHALSLRPLSEFLIIEMPRPGRQPASGQPSQPADAVRERPASGAHRAAAWTPEETLDAIAQASRDRAAVAVTVCDWAAARPYIRVTGGTGLSYPSLTMSADTTRSPSRYRSVLSVCQPARRTRDARDPGQADVPNASLPSARHASALPGRPDQPWHPPDRRRARTRSHAANIPLQQLTVGRAEKLLSLIDRWIIDVQGDATEPEPSNEE